MTTRIRAKAIPKTLVGKHRYVIYLNAYKRISEAVEAGFYLEAVTLIESLLADRLESRLSYVKGEEFSFKTLDRIVNSAKGEPDDILRKIVQTDVTNWKDQRNKALHEMAKIEDGDWSLWENRYAKLNKITTNGMSILRSVDKRYKELFRQKA